MVARTIGAHAAPTGTGDEGFAEWGSMTAVGLPGRFAYDAELCARIRESRCEGKEWEDFATTLYKKAVRTANRWIVEGFIFLQCRQRGRTVSPGDLSKWSAADIEELAHDVVTENFTVFVRIGILGGDWDPRKGAGLFTYFMNGVVLCFPNVFRRHMTARSNWQQKVDLHHDLDSLDHLEPTEYSSSLSQCAQLLNKLLGAIRSPDQRRVAQLYFIECLSAKQIAYRLDTTDAAVRSLLNRAKQAMQSAYRTAEGGGS